MLHVNDTDVNNPSTVTDVANTINAITECETKNIEAHHENVKCINTSDDPVYIDEQTYIVCCTNAIKCDNAVILDMLLPTCEKYFTQKKCIKFLQTALEHNCINSVIVLASYPQIFDIMNTRFCEIAPYMRSCSNELFDVLIKPMLITASNVDKLTIQTCAMLMRLTSKMGNADLFERAYFQHCELSLRYKDKLKTSKQL